jgi:hypothetical protein
MLRCEVRIPPPIVDQIERDFFRRRSHKVPDDRNFETEGDAIESGLKRTIAGRDAVMRNLIRAVPVRAAALVAQKKDDFGSALQNLYWKLERAESLVGPS